MMLLTKGNFGTYIGSTMIDPWFLIGDLNIVLSQKETLSRLFLTKIKLMNLLLAMKKKMEYKMLCYMPLFYLELYIQNVADP